MGLPMRLRSASRHLRNKHYDCWSCRIEKIMIDMMIQGRGVYWESRALDIFGATTYPPNPHTIV